MRDPAEVLDRECATFTRYLTGMTADEYILARYRDGHRTIPYLNGGDPHPLDATLLRASRRGGLGLRSADAYARIFCPRCVLRQKLILLLSILENARQTHAILDSAVEGGAVRTMIFIVGQVSLGGAVLLLGAARFGPRQFASRASVRAWFRFREPAT